MAADDKSTIQCAETDKAVLAKAAEQLRWTLPEVMHLAAECVSRIVEGEETREQRTQRMLDRLQTPGRQVSNRSRTSVTPESHASVTPIEQAS